MVFFWQWLWYLLAFLVGSVLAYMIVVLTFHRTSEAEAIADLPGSREIGAR
jgi:uncharacterized membrane protein ArfB